ncbi:hypothetical protein [Schumannella soli]|uniref:Uncharacterized protein n=1 Tax=Schumannella soli TaxID=2590779 RepID=A0A506YB71_9MICO|nr:hypothetical protein [Schumannella soli]TPW77719.1 hypothetical protein FJ657_03435 [Schumannella soli]
MTSPTLEPRFASAVRDELTAIGTRSSLLERRQRRSRLLTAGAIAVGVVAATTGAGLVAATAPGSTTVAPSGDAVTVTRTGTSTIELGPRNGANAVILDVTCVSDHGAISVPTSGGLSFDADGTTAASPGTTEWDCAETTAVVHIPTGYAADGSASITVTADPGTEWEATARWGVSTTSDWGVNSEGQTYGEPNALRGYPDLVPVRASNGRDGFAYSKDFIRPHSCGDSLPVYAVNGTTVVGEFPFGEPSGPGCAPGGAKPSGAASGVTTG